MPKWLADMNSRKYNISIAAKAPAGIAPDPQRNAEAMDIIDAMLRALLIDRYKMTVHYENRPMDAYTLVAAKPKLAKADPANRTGCTRQNQPMAQFAEQIQAYDFDIDYPVLDDTGITGAWDFTIDFDAIAKYGSVPISPDGDDSDPSGSVPFVKAVEKLGLKLEVHKRPEPVLVIDHIEKKPTEN
jgi:uncharacterized protein (TIGR03435 family)